jgi:MarR family 2-MHQ and catechol resistance regulon transcriptional repressor
MRGMGERYLKSVRLLAECLQGFERFSNLSVRQCGLTPAQFDILATLGNTAGLTIKELGERTLITKGTLTGVIDRLEQKGLVTRQRSADDKRSFLVILTADGARVFDDTFPAVVAHGRLMFSSCSEADFEAMDQTFRKFKQLVADAESAAASMPTLAASTTLASTLASPLAPTLTSPLTSTSNSKEPI